MLRRTSSLCIETVHSCLIQLEESETLNEKAFFALCFFVLLYSQFNLFVYLNA